MSSRFGALQVEVPLQTRNPGDAGSVEVAGALLRRALGICRRSWLSLLACSSVMAISAGIACVWNPSNGPAAVMTALVLVEALLVYSMQLIIVADDLTGLSTNRLRVVSCLSRVLVPMLLVHCVIWPVTAGLQVLLHGILGIGGWVLASLGLSIGAPVLENIASYVGYLFGTVVLGYVPAVVVLERGTFIRTIRRSWHLLRCGWREIFWLLGPIHLGSRVLADFINAALGAQTGEPTAGAIVADAVVSPFDAACTIVVYVWLRARLEGYDVQQLRDHFDSLSRGERTT